MRDFRIWWKSFDSDEIASIAEELAAEAQSMTPGYKVTMYFSYRTYMLGTAWAFGDFEQSNFTLSTSGLTDLLAFAPAHERSGRGTLLPPNHLRRFRMNRNAMHPG